MPKVSRTVTRAKSHKFGFTVDTNLFRELGQMLVGRDSTALAELIKNSYDADAQRVTVYGESLDDKTVGFVRIIDDGSGMTLEQFRNGFLRVASRYKSRVNHWTPNYARRVTGAKGIGRLAAHKLAEIMDVESIARTPNGRLESLTATIDWGAIERNETLEEAQEAVTVITKPLQRGRTGTTITLRKLRRGWTEKRRQAFVRELDSFRPPEILHDPLPKRIVRTLPLLKAIVVRDEDEPSEFTIDLTGDFDVGEEYWRTVLSEASWLIEVDGRDNKDIAVRIAPTERMRRDTEFGMFIGKDPYNFRFARPGGAGPLFEARVLYRSGQSELGRGTPFGIRFTWKAFESCHMAKTVMIGSASMRTTLGA